MSTIVDKASNPYFITLDVSTPIAELRQRHDDITVELNTLNKKISALENQLRNEKDKRRRRSLQGEHFPLVSKKMRLTSELNVILKQMA